jgi:hypothetical protein
MDAAAERLLAAQRETYRFEEEARQTMEPGDLFYGMPAEIYIGVLLGQDAKRGFFRCPFHSDEDERTPSLHATGPLWYCHACRRGGTIYDFGAERYGIEPRKDGFAEIRERLRRDLGGVHA